MKICGETSGLKERDSARPLTNGRQFDCGLRLGAFHLETCAGAQPRSGDDGPENHAEEERHCERNADGVQESSNRWNRLKRTSWVASFKT